MHIIGRDRELTVLHEAWRAAAARPGVVLVEGGAGIGKTALVTAFAATVDATVLIGEAPSLGGDVQPYAPFLAALGAVDPGRAAFLARIEAAAPVLLVLADLDRSDQASRELLGYLAATLSRPRVL